MRATRKGSPSALSNTADITLLSERSSPLRDSGGKVRKQSRDNDSTSSSLSPPATPSNAMDVDEKKKAEESESDDSDDGRPKPRPVPQNQTFGEDPSTFPDPTVYEVREVVPGMTIDEIKEIYSVASYPKSDLADLIAGDPPDKDFSSAKPSNQINFSTFNTYLEPFFRPFTEEDLAFLRERGDRVTPFVMPKRGKKHYSELWAEEDHGMQLDSSPAGRDKLQPNQPRGTIDHMTDDIGETDKLSVGPLLSRLLESMRPESRAPASDAGPNGVNGDAPNGGDVSMNGADPFTDQPNGAAHGDEKAPPPAAYMPESSSESWKKATHPKLEYTQVDERIKQELRHTGFLPPPDALPPPVAPGSGVPSGAGDPADYDGAYDDEVAARLRLLQDRLREQMLRNGAHKARLTDLVKERMAHQEYQTILEDLDTQVQAAYLKRTRTMGKSKKGKARPGGAGGGSAPAAAQGLPRPGIGDLTRTLMERRKRWIENIGAVFDDEHVGRVPRAGDGEPGENGIFAGAEMVELMKREKEAWDEEVEEE
jgi:transcriptional adapter 3